MKNPSSTLELLKNKRHPARQIKNARRSIAAQQTKDVAADNLDEVANSMGDVFAQQAIYIIDEDGDVVAKLFQDGAGNLQFDLTDDTKAYTVNDGNVISGHGTGKDSGFYLHENFVTKGKLWWDADLLNVSVENVISAGDILFVLNGGTPASEYWTFYDRTADVARFRFSNFGRFDLRELASAPSNPGAGYLAVYAKDDGTLHVLDSSGTDTELGAGGSAGTARQMWVGGWRPTITNGCYYQAQLEMGTNKNVYDYWAFDPTAIMYAYANAAMPVDYSGGAIKATFYWTHPATTTNFKVSWGLQAVSFSDNNALDAAQGTAQYSNDTGGTTSNLYISPETSDITIGGTPVAGDLVNFRAFRKADDGTNDTLAVDAYLIGVMITYPIS